MKIKVTFYKEIKDNPWENNTRIERVELTHEFDNSKSEYENYADAFDKACRLGHNPNKGIKFLVL